MTKPHVDQGFRNGAEAGAAVSGDGRRLNRISLLKPEFSGGALPADSTAETEQGFVLVDLSFKALLIPQATPTGVDGTAAAPAHDGHVSCLVPNEVEQVIRELLGADLPSTKLRLRVGNREYKMRATRMQLPGTSPIQDVLALHLERADEAEDRIRELSAKYRLTGREEEALRGIATGLASKELAERMNINPSTVKSFLRLTMIKLGVRTRGELFAKLLEQQERE